MTDAITTSISTIIGALVGGLCAVYGAIKAVEKSTAGLEQSEIRRQRVMCVINLSGYRYVLADPQPGQVIPQNAPLRSMFMVELNKVPALWSDDERVVRNLRDFNADRSNERLPVLLRSLAATTPLRFDRLPTPTLSTYSGEAA